MDTHWWVLIGGFFGGIVVWCAQLVLGVHIGAPLAALITAAFAAIVGGLGPTDRPSSVGDTDQRPPAPA